jgi:hypothetical protein
LRVVSFVDQLGDADSAAPQSNAAASAAELSQLTQAEQPWQSQRQAFGLRAVEQAACRLCQSNQVGLRHWIIIGLRIPADFKEMTTKKVLVAQYNPACFSARLLLIFSTLQLIRHTA